MWTVKCYDAEVFQGYFKTFFLGQNFKYNN